MSRRTVLPHYADSSLGQRIFLALRAYTAPYDAMASLLPTTGRILDVGCGHGLLSLTAAQAEPARDILGVDHSEERIAAARQAAQRAGYSARFEVGSFLAPPPGPFDAIAAIDIFHYFEPHEQAEAVRTFAEQLAPGGLLMIREVDTTDAGSSRVNRWYERVSTTIGITRSDAGTRMHFRSPTEWAALFESHGLSATTQACTFPIFTDVLILGRKR